MRKSDYGDILKGLDELTALAIGGVGGGIIVLAIGLIFDMLKGQPGIASAKASYDILNQWSGLFDLVGVLGIVLGIFAGVAKLFQSVGGGCGQW